MNLTKYERETIINFNEEEQTASVFTYNRKLQNKLNALLDECQDIKLMRSGDEWTEYEVPKKWIKVSPPRSVNYTEEQKAEIAARLQATRNKV